MIPDTTRWRTLRAGYLEAARKCRAALTEDTQCSYIGLDGTQHAYVMKAKYQPGDPRVHEAVEKWVARAKKAHAFALGREPVVKDFVFIGPEGAYQGPVYAMGAGRV